MSKLLNKYTREKGFTIIELALVLVIVGILATLSVTAYSRLALKAKRVEARNALKGLAKEEFVFFSEYDRYSDNFNLLSFDPTRYEYYSLSLSASTDDFTGRAEGNLDADPDFDIWVVHKEGVPILLQED